MSDAETELAEARAARRAIVNGGASSYTTESGRTYTALDVDKLTKLIAILTGEVLAERGQEDGVARFRSPD